MTTTSPEVALITASVFADERSRTPTPFEGTARDLVGGRHRVRDVNAGTTCFSPVVYADGAKRGKRGVAHATALVLDFDHLSTDAAEDVHRKLAARGWAWLAYSSFSHHVGGADDVCFRLLVLVSRPITPAEYDAVWESAALALGGYADRNARDISACGSSRRAPPNAPSTRGCAVPPADRWTCPRRSQRIGASSAQRRNPPRAPTGPSPAGTATRA